MKSHLVSVKKMRRASQIFRLLVIASILALAVPAAAQQGIQIQKAIYGVVPHGPSCDATAAMRQQCNGKDGCGVYVDPRYLCPDPAFRKLKSLVVTYGCNGKVETLSFPDTAQAVLKCSGGTKGATTTSVNTPATPPKQPQFTSQSFANSAWQVQGNPDYWVLQGDGTAHDEKNTWRGTWRLTGNVIQIDGRNSNGSTFSIPFTLSPDGRAFYNMVNGRRNLEGGRVR